MSHTDFHADEARRYLEVLFAELPGRIEVRTIREQTKPEQSFHESIDSALVAIERAADTMWWAARHSNHAPPPTFRGLAAEAEESSWRPALHALAHGRGGERATIVG